MDALRQHKKSHRGLGLESVQLPPGRPVQDLSKMVLDTGPGLQQQAELDQQQLVTQLRHSQSNQESQFSKIGGLNMESLVSTSEISNLALMRNYHKMYDS